MPQVVHHGGRPGLPQSPATLGSGGRFCYNGPIRFPGGIQAAMPDSTGDNSPEYTVGEIAGSVKRSLEERFGHVRVRGEVSQPKRHGSGHWYLRLKDADAVLESVIWRGNAMRLRQLPEEGLEVVATGRLTTYPGRSQYQLVIERMELAGQGALLKMLEERRLRLAADGLFAEERKRALPTLPRCIGIVTSPTGAVIQDMLHRLADRFPRPVLLWPVAVQGERAAGEVAAAIAGFNALPPERRPDLLIVARGGGSLEDLMAFNEEAVVRAAAASAIPLISAVGHETDWTLIDHAADWRAPTPTAAAERAVPVRAELQLRLAEQALRLGQSAQRLVVHHRRGVAALARALPDPQRRVESCWQILDHRGERLSAAVRYRLESQHRTLERIATRLRHPRERLQEMRLRLEGEARSLERALRNLLLRHGDRLEVGRRRSAALAERLAPALQRRLGTGEDRLAAASRLLESLSYRNVLARGFVLVHGEDDRPVTGAAMAQPGQAVSLEFADGRVAAVLAGSAPPPRPRKRSDDNDAGPAPRQGSLL